MFLHQISLTSSISPISHFSHFSQVSTLSPTYLSLNLSGGVSLIRETHFKVHFTSVSGEGRLCLLSPWKVLHSTVCFSSPLLNPPGENLSLLPITTWNTWTQPLQSHAGFQQRGKYRTGHTF